jgi:hypothetical protein
MGHSRNVGEAPKIAFNISCISALIWSSGATRRHGIAYYKIRHVGTRKRPLKKENRDKEEKRK